jgi:hypothetical protein
MVREEDRKEGRMVRQVLRDLIQYNHACKSVNGLCVGYAEDGGNVESCIGYSLVGELYTYLLVGSKYRITSYSKANSNAT